MIKNKIILLLITVVPLLSIAQKKITISGYVRDMSSKEVLIGASIINANTKSGTATNQYGFFSITAPVSNTIELVVSFSGYNISAKKIVTKKNIRLDILMEGNAGNLGEVVVTSSRNNRNVQKSTNGCN